MKSKLPFTRLLAFLLPAVLLSHLATAAAATAEKSTSEATPTATQHKPLNILLVGASGMIGSRILKEATSRGHHVMAASRHPEKIAKDPEVKAVQLDAMDREAFTRLASTADVIVMATSARSTGDPIKESKDLGDAAIAAAKASGKRLIMVGGAGSLNFPDGKPVVDSLPDAYRGEARGMRNTLDTLKKSDANWTFISPPMSIAPGQRTDKFRVGTTTLLTDANGKSRISAEDYADALVNELEKPEHVRGQMTVAY